MNIVLFGRIPSKKNSKQLVCRGRFPMVLSSEKFKDWHIEASWQLKPQIYSIKEPLKNIHMVLTFFAPDKRATDLSNKAESVMDLLVDNGVIEDDNWFVCPDLHLKFGGVDTLKPRCEIEIIPQ